MWSKNPIEWKRWEDEKWCPEDQESLLELIEPVVRKVSWDVPRQEEWRKEFSKNARNQVADYAFAATRTVLTRDLPAYVSGVEAMGPAYRTLDQLEKEFGVKKDWNSKALPASVPTAVLGWELVVPDDPRLTDDELLRETVAFVTGDAEFRRHRTRFWNWQQKYLKGGVTDRESIGAAVKEMQQLLEEQKAAAG